MDIHTVNLKYHSSLRIGGTGRLMHVDDVRDITRLAMFARGEGATIVPLGEGTNSYFGDVPESIIFAKINLRGVSLEDQGDEVYVTALAGENFDELVAFTVKQGLWGLENLSSIPGSVGAAPVQNIGAYGAELKDTLISVTAFDVKSMVTVEISREACAFGYRDSLFKHEKGRYIIISIRLCLSKTPKPVLTYKPLDSLLGNKEVMLTEIRDLVVATRAQKLPDYKLYPNTGSFFKNPIVSKEEGLRLKEKYPVLSLIETGPGYKIPAASLIEHVAEMKGVRVGDIGTWPNQPLVIVNYGEATKEALENFVQTITTKVFEGTGITLEQEVNAVS